MQTLREATMDAALQTPADVVRFLVKRHDTILAKG
jgi:hypothetical protein